MKPSPERSLPVAEMSGAQLSRYRRALVHYLKRCSLDDPQHGKVRACLAEVLAEEQTRRQADHASLIMLTVPRETAGQPGSDDLTLRIFRALYQDFDLLTIGVIHIVTPKDTPVFIGDSLGQIARQISDHERGDPVAPSAGALPADHLPARVPPRS